MDPVGTWLSLLPPLVAIALALATRQIYLSLFLGLWSATTLLAHGDPLDGLARALEACVHVFADAGNTRVILFSALIGALIAFTQVTGGVTGFVDAIARRRLVDTPARALLLSWLIGLVVFVESSITSLVNGAVCRPLFDKLRLSREKLAYLCDATAAPVCVLIPLNAWGAFITGLLAAEGFDQPVGLLVAALPLNFYALATLAFSLVVVVLLRRDFGPMARAERRVRETGELLRPGAVPVVAAELSDLAPAPGTPPRARNFLLPMAVMVLMMPIGLTITGDGDPLRGSGSTSVLWAVLAATAVAAGLGLAQRVLTFRATQDLFFKGFGALLPLALLMVFAFALGDLTKALGTGAYVAQLASSSLAPALLPAVVFLLGAAISFSTGTSWGTFALMMPIALPAAAALGVPPALAVGAVLSGGVFGDHASPISDTTIIASMAAGTDHMDHVRTQLPYALVVGAASLLAYLVAGLVA